MFTQNAEYVNVRFYGYKLNQSNIVLFVDDNNYTSSVIMHSERDFIELQRLYQLYDKSNDCCIGLYHQNEIHWKWMDDKHFVYANLLCLYSWINRKLNGFCDAIMLRLSDKYLLDDIASELCTNVSSFVVFNGDCKTVSVDKWKK